MSLPSRFGSRYRVVREVGRGATGQAYQAEDLRLRREVALKVLAVLEEGQASAEVRQRFAREAALLAEHPHPGLLAILDAELEASPPFLVLPWMPGGSLGERIARGPAPAPEVRSTGRRLAGALGHLHEHGVLHRDVKPENVLLDARGQPFLADLGLGLGGEEDRLTRTGLIVGTPRYLARETVERGEYSPRSDLFSLAAILLELATGRRLEGPATDANLLAALLREVPDPDLARALRGALRQEPGDRFPDAAALAQALQEESAAGPVGPDAATLTGPLPGPAPLPPRRARWSPGPSPRSSRTPWRACSASTASQTDAWPLRCAGATTSGTRPRWSRSSGTPATRSPARCWARPWTGWRSSTPGGSRASRSASRRCATWSASPSARTPCWPSPPAPGPCSCACAFTCLPTLLHQDEVPLARRRPLYLDAAAFLRASPPGLGGLQRLELGLLLMAYWFSAGIRALEPEASLAAFQLGHAVASEELTRDPAWALQVLTLTRHQHTAATLLSGDDGAVDAHMDAVEALARRAAALVGGGAAAP